MVVGECGGGLRSSPSDLALAWRRKACEWRCGVLLKRENAQPYNGAWYLTFEVVRFRTSLAAKVRGTRSPSEEEARAYRASCGFLMEVSGGRFLLEVG